MPRSRGACPAGRDGPGDHGAALDTFTDVASGTLRWGGALATELLLLPATIRSLREVAWSRSEPSTAVLGAIPGVRRSVRSG